MKASDLFIEQLEAEGVEHVFGVPGEENLDFVESLRTSNIQLVVTRHEQAAGFMAATYGRLTGKVGVCLATLGPGATNLVTAAAYAQLGAMPMLMITGQKPIKTSKQGQFQIIDVVKMMDPLTKYTRQIVSGDTVPTHVHEAIRLAQEERPGAVHLEFPEDIAREPSDAKLVEPHNTRRPVAEEKAIKKAVEMIHAAKRPLLLIGAGGNRKMTAKMLNAFVEKTGMYFFTTQMGKGVIDEAHPLCLGTAALSENDYLHCAINRADLIINVGHDVVEKPPFFMNGNDVQVIHVNYFSATVDPIYAPQHEVVGDIANAMWQMSELAEKQDHWDLAYYKKIEDEVEHHTAALQDDDRYPVIPQRIVADVRSAMPNDGIIALDNGIYKIWFARNYKAHEPNTVLVDNALATMGAGLPSAMGAKIVYPDKKVLAICGDGGFMMNSQELETAVRLGLDITVLILKDDAYGMIKWKQDAMELPSFGLDYGNPDFVAYAESYGARGHRVEKTADFQSILNNAIETPGVDVIELPVDYSENERVLTKELAEKTCVL